MDKQSEELLAARNHSPLHPHTGHMFKYCADADHVDAALEVGGLWASSYDALNDPFEGDFFVESELFSENASEKIRRN